jgi:hypothetical protein
MEGRMARLFFLLICLGSAHFLGGCKESGGADAQEKDPAPEANAKLAQALFVQASTLKLRAEPSPGSKVKGRLAINYPLQVLEKEGDFARVKTRNNKEGWVGHAFLGKARVTKELALNKAGALSGKEKLAWLQRAAAVVPTDVEVLEQLEKSYEEVGNMRASEMVHFLVETLKARYYPIRQDKEDGLWVEWSVFYPPGEVKARDVPESEWGQKGIPANLGFFVLPEKGPAVSGKVKKVRIEAINECAGDAGILLQLDAKMPKGQKALVAVHENAPKSWSESVSMKKVENARALLMKVALDVFKGKKESEVDLGMTTGTDGVRARAFVEAPTADDDIFVQSKGIDLFLGKDGKVKQLGKSIIYNGFTPKPFARRDVDGDGHPDTFMADGCSESIVTDKGVNLIANAFRCCGC